MENVCLKCAVCMEPFSEDGLRPVSGTCGHTICSPCSKKFEDRCPICRRISFTKPVPNFLLLNLLEILSISFHPFDEVFKKFDGECKEELSLLVMKQKQYIMADHETKWQKIQELFHLCNRCLIDFQKDILLISNSISRASVKAFEEWRKGKMELLDNSIKMHAKNVASNLEKEENLLILRKQSLNCFQTHLHNLMDQLNNKYLGLNNIDDLKIFLEKETEREKILDSKLEKLVSLANDILDLEITLKCKMEDDDLSYLKGEVPSRNSMPIETIPNCLSGSRTHNIVLVGDPGSGKKTFFQNLYSTAKVDDIGVIHKLSFLTNKGVLLMNICTNEKPETVNSFWEKPDGALVMYNATENESLKETDKYVVDIQDCSGSVPILFLANKKDLGGVMYFDDDMDTLAISAKTGENILESFVWLIEKLTGEDGVEFEATPMKPRRNTPDNSLILRRDKERAKFEESRRLDLMSRKQSTSFQLFCID